MFDFLKRDQTPQKPTVPQPAYARFSEAQIEEEIKRKGYWEEFDEWRIFTTTSFRITPIEQLDAKNQTKKLVYAVQVKCDYDLRCECPTLKRAIHFCEVYQQWIMKAFRDEGWPSWAQKTKFEADK
jgi:hypothetical protein